MLLIIGKREEFYNFPNFKLYQNSKLTERRSVTVYRNIMLTNDIIHLFMYYNNMQYRASLSILCSRNHSHYLIVIVFTSYIFPN